VRNVPRGRKARLVDEAADSSEPRGRGMSAVGSRYRATASEDASVDTGMCV
jgi:hypothetical protein